MEQKVLEMLQAKLPATAVKTRSQGGQTVSYIDGHFAISQANDVFGPDGWSYATGAIVEVARFVRPGKSGENTVIIYEAQVTVTALGVTRGDVGVGVCDSGLNGLAQGIEKARKEAVTDGIKRALRSYGPRFGLALYDKTQSDVGASFESQALLGSLAAATDLEAWATENKAAIEGLDADDKAEVRGAYIARQKALRPALASVASLPAPALSVAEAAEAEFKSATSLAALDAAVTRHAKALANLADQDRQYLRGVVRTHKADLERGVLVSQLLADAGRAVTEDEARTVHARLTAAALAGKVSQDDAESVTEALNERLAMQAA